MNKTEILNSLTNSQRQEFEKDIKSTIDKMIETKNIFANKLHQANINLRLENKIFLNVTLEFTIDNEKNEISAHIKEIVKFDNINQYLESILVARQRDDNSITIK